MTDQDDDDEHVKLLNPVKVGTYCMSCCWLQGAVKDSGA